MRYDHELITYLNNVNESFGGQVMELPSLYGEIKFIRMSLDKNLASSEVDWDSARFDLANLTLTREKSEKILLSLTQATQEEAWRGSEATQQQIDTIIKLVLAFTVIIVLVAIYVGYYTQINIRKTAKRRALAKFPERNPNPVLNLNYRGDILFGNRFKRS